MNPQEKETRPENREEARKSKTDKPSRLGKEAKIGAALILVLLVVFVGVVAAKLSGWNSDDQKPAEMADRDIGRHKSPESIREEHRVAEERSKPFANRTLTVVTPERAMTPPPKVIDSNLGKWQMPPARSEPKRNESHVDVMNIPPPFETEPAKEHHVSRSEQVAIEPTPRHDDHVGRYEPVAAELPARHNDDDGGRFGKGHNELRPDPPVVKRSEPASHGDFSDSGFARKHLDRDDSSGYASAGAAAQAIPAYRGNSRYEDRSAAPLPSERDSRPYMAADRDSATRSIGRNDDDDDHRPSAWANHDRGDADFRDVPSYERHTPRADGKYEVQPNDSYWTISQKVYGSGAYFQALVEHNRSKSNGDERLQPGQLISTPSERELAKSYPDLCPKAGRREASANGMLTVSGHKSYRGGRTYTVAEGDTLFNIARYELGKASRWAEIYDMNRDVLGKDFNYLTPGTQLTLPDNERSDVLARQPGDGYR